MLVRLLEHKVNTINCIFSTQYVVVVIVEDFSALALLRFAVLSLISGHCLSAGSRLSSTRSIQATNWCTSSW